MVEVYSEVIAGILGAIIAIFFREIFAWKEPGRIEALKRHENLITECFGRLRFLVAKFDTDRSDLVITRNDYMKLNELYRRYSFRFPENIRRDISKIISEGVFLTNHIGDWAEMPYNTGIDAIDFKSDLEKEIDSHITDLINKIRKLESYYESIINRIWFSFFVWNF